MTAGTFLLFPGDVHHKAHLVLQGVCAQRPSHSFAFLGQPLPVDARMTGIYLGAAASLLWFIMLCRARCSGQFTRGTWMLLAVSIAVMAVDGLNALAADLAIPTPYDTTNWMRVATGLLSGVAIGTLLSHLVTIALTHRPPGGWKPATPRSLAPPLALGGGMCAVAASGLPPVALPYTLLILASALVVLWAMTSVLAALVLRRGWGFVSGRQRDETLALAFITASILLLGLASWREVLESFLGPLKLS